MKDKTYISAIILVYHDEKFLHECVASIRTSAKIAKVNLEIIIVVNDIHLKKKRFKFPKKCTLILNRKNLGFGKSINQAAKIARGDWLLLANADTLAYKDTLKNLLTYSGNKKIGIIAPKVFKNNGLLQHTILEEPTLWNIFKEQSYLYRLFPSLISSPQVDDKLYAKTHQVHFITAISYLIRRNVFQKGGEFDERFFIYYEDIDLCKRIRAEGYSIILEPKAKIVHYLHQSFGGVTNGEYYIQSLYKYLSKYHSKLYALLGITFLASGCLIRLIHWYVKKRHTKTQSIKYFATKKISYCSLIIKSYFKIILTSI